MLAPPIKNALVAPAVNAPLTPIVPSAKNALTALASIKQWPKISKMNARPLLAPVF